MNTIDYNITIWCIRMYKQNITKKIKHLDTQVKKQIFTFATAFPFITLLDKIFVIPAYYQRHRQWHKRSGSQRFLCKRVITHLESK